jgi:phosphoglycerol geranylgeranyltransferase
VAASSTALHSRPSKARLKSSQTASARSSCNSSSIAAQTAGIEETFTPEQVAGAALATESLYGFPIFHIEHSGTYGGTKDVAAAAKCLSETVLLYGGGITRRTQTEEILESGADAVVVGNCFHEDSQQYPQTIL